MWLPSRLPITAYSLKIYNYDPFIDKTTDHRTLLVLIDFCPVWSEILEFYLLKFFPCFEFLRLYLDIFDQII